MIIDLLQQEIEELKKQLKLEMEYYKGLKKDRDQLLKKLQNICKHEKFCSLPSSCTTISPNKFYCAICRKENKFEYFMKIKSKMVGGFE